MNDSVTAVHTKMVELAAPHMVSYHSDLLHDQRALENNKADGRFLWGYRATGTYLGSLTPEGKAWTQGLVRYYGGSMIWHLIDVKKGTVTPLSLRDAQRLAEDLEEPR
jgi:hypothetical protein